MAQVKVGRQANHLNLLNCDDYDGLNDCDGDDDGLNWKSQSSLKSIEGYVKYSYLRFVDFSR